MICERAARNENNHITAALTAKPIPYKSNTLLACACKSTCRCPKHVTWFFRQTYVCLVHTFCTGRPMHWQYFWKLWATRPALSRSPASPRTVQTWLLYKQCAPQSCYDLASAQDQRYIKTCFIHFLNVTNAFSSFTIFIRNARTTRTSRSLSHGSATRRPEPQCTLSHKARQGPERP